MSLGKRSADAEAVGGPARPRGPRPQSSREVQHLDASALKAYAHPLRLQIIRLLNDHGPATATTLAERLGESTGQTSYHLRQLARHGLVEDDPDRGSGRERWWRPTSFTVDATQLREDPTLAPAALAMLSSVVQSRAETMGAWVARSGEAPQHWVDASVHSQSTMHLTPAEVLELSEGVQEVLDRFAAVSRSREKDGAGDPTDPGAVQRVRLYYDAFPLLPDAG